MKRDQKKNNFRKSHLTVSVILRCENKPVGKCSSLCHIDKEKSLQGSEVCQVAEVKAPDACFASLLRDASVYKKKKEKEDRSRRGNPAVKAPNN